ncbi:hypothetical protein PT7_3066 [Pusillimonas sp. T7-7]|uniref:hypothetical protein n=1 Tax=Pusillimonas sp. (strain T7-7) TaxID=1007105 RepID=UPI00020848F9|nr:hypothetical protein [Pusillimonas sp. T7-7]AEC21606.1 hypothetical protein PT7_3066 [Pusillimonas sp. T7-7]
MAITARSPAAWNSFRHPAGIGAENKNELAYNCGFRMNERKARPDGLMILERLDLMRYFAKKYRWSRMQKIARLWPGYFVTRSNF